MLSAQNISVSFGGFNLFDNLNFRLGSGDRVALIGKNGAVKNKSNEIIDIIIEQPMSFSSILTSTIFNI